MTTRFFNRHMLRAAMGLLLCVHASSAAQSIIQDTEPNDTPEVFQPVVGEVRIMGTMPGADQDGFRWTVDKENSLRPWTFTLQGIPGALTTVDVLQLEYGEGRGTVTGTKKFFSMQSLDGTRPVVVSGLLFEPGEYVLGFANAGSGGSDALVVPAHGYRFDINSGNALRLSRSPAADTPREKAPALRLNDATAMAAPATQSWYRFTLNEAAAQQRWDLTFRSTVGQSLNASLQDHSGTPLATARTNAHGEGALRDLSLPQGEYFLSLESNEGALQALALTSVGLTVAEEEAEPNNAWVTANRIDFFQGVNGRLQVDGDTDVYRFELTEEHAGRRLALSLETQADDPYTVCLLNESGRNIHCRTPRGAWRLDGLSLVAGQYGVRLERGKTGMEYRLLLQDDGKPDAGLESEPNDSREWAGTVQLGKRIRGSFDRPDDIDFYRIDVDDTPQLWRFQVNGNHLRDLLYYDGRGRNLQRVFSGEKDTKRLMLDRLYLAPGTHYISIIGSKQGEYVLLSRAQGVPDPNAETEPNDSAAHMLAMRMEQTRTGGFHDRSDKDMYYFQLSGHEHIRLHLQAPADDAVKMRVILHWEGALLRDLQLTSGQETTLEGVYPPGSYTLTLSTNQYTDGQYSIGLQRLPRYTCRIDCEPNDNAAFSSPLPADGRIIGSADTSLFGETDWYALPVRDQDTEWHFSTESKASLALHINQDENPQRLQRKSAQEHYQVSVPAHRQAYLIVSPKEDYEIQALPGGLAPITEAPADLSALTLSVALPTREVAAYAPFGQQVEGAIQLSNAGERAVALKLDALASDLSWDVALQENTIEIPAGASQDIPVQIRVPDDARSASVQISVRAAHASGAFVHAEAAVETLPDAPLVGPYQYWVVPDDLRGGVNLAAASLGARVLPGKSSTLYRNPDNLIDGIAGSSDEFEFLKQKLPYEANVTVELAGDGTQPIAGFALNPYSHRPMHRGPQHFSVALSDDGTQFDTVLSGTLQPLRREQYFVLHAPRPARFARLTVHQNYNGDWGGNTAIGEWQVISMTGSDLATGIPLNLADRRHGGHVVDSYPPHGRSWYWVDPETKTSSGRGTLELPGGTQGYLVLGFHDNRAARVDRIVWGKAREGKGQLIERVDVQVSLHGPVGPWASIGQLEPKLEQNVEWQLPHPVWARYLRFELLPVLETRHEVAAPTSVQVYEAQTDEQYRSILGLWSDDTKAIYEASHPAEVPASLDPDIPNGTRETPQNLEVGESISGQVQLGNQEHWYRVRMPENTNQLDVRLSDPFYLKAALSAETAAGEALVLSPVQAEGNARHWTVSAQPGAELFIRVFEPPRNVIFAWDTSGSVANYREQTYNAIGEYARGLLPGRDMANLLPFDGVLQLHDWQGDPHLMLQAVNEHKGTDSSNAESTLVTASQALARRSGSRAVVLLTDAETTIDHRVWPALEQGRPQIVALGLGAPTILEKRLMLNWSRVNGGHYSAAHDVNDMAQAFERASVILRQPAAYQLQVNAEFVEPPADGALRVVAGQVPTGDTQRKHAGPVTAIILDASGSMLQRLDGERRIEIAKRGLMQAVSEQIPPGTPVSLRVFGHKEADSCRSDLEIPLQPLNTADAQKVISRIQAKNLARTPIADSLSLVRQDLAQAKGPRTIVLVTDGEETCDGDPEAVIQELISEGYDLRLNIIGFALDDPILEQIFSSWATLGGGEYFSAADKESFDQAVGKALQVNYTVVNAAGHAVAQGLVDGVPVALPPGTYQVRVGVVPELLLDTVLVVTEETTTIEVN